MPCSDSTSSGSLRLKRKRSPVFSPEQMQQQEDNLDEPRDLKKTKHHSTWENLDLILTLQSKELLLERKIKVAYDFVSFEADKSDEHLQPISFSRVLRYLCDWVQSLLMSSHRNSKTSELLDPCLDYRCWVIIRVCLEKSSPGASRNLFRAIAHVLKQALLLLDTNSTSDVQSILLFENVLEYLSLFLASNSRAFYSVGMHLWSLCAVDVFNIINRVFVMEEQESSIAKALLNLSELMLEHFASFLRFHPNPKSIFHVFVESLLEQLFDLLILLQLRTKGNNCKKFGSTLKIVENVMLNGLFHPGHINGFLSSASSSLGQVGSKGANESYHRHFFRKLEKVIREKKITAFGGFPCLLRLFASKARGQQGSLSFKQALKRANGVSGDAQNSSVPLFEVFMHFIKPLLQECKHSAENELSRMTGASEHRLIELHCMFKSVNDILEIFIQEKIYVRTEDTPEGKHYCFLKEIYDAIYSICIKVHLFWFSELQMGDEVKRMLPLIAREIVVGVGYFLEIEYRVFGDYLVTIWSMLLSFMTANLCMTSSKPCSLLMNEILNIGCKLINVYSELRQVNTPLFALCKAVRFLISTNDIITHEYKLFSSSFQSFPMCLQAAKSLLCSQELRLTIVKAVKLVSEGQACSCIQQLNLDISDALEWIRQSSLSVDRIPVEKAKVANAYVSYKDIQAEVLGRVLCELYTTVLESLSISPTNSILIGNAINNLIKTLKPSLSCFLQIESDRVNYFVLSVLGRRLSNPEFTENGNSSEVKVQSMCWLFIFFFRVYASSRCLYRQSISLMSPDLSHKASESFGDSFTSSSYMDWVDTPENMDAGYFSWIAKPSISLPEAITILQEFFPSGFAAHAPLVYILQIMTVQRLSDLSRLIKAFEYFNEKDALVNKLQLQDNTTAPKSTKKWKRLIATSREEASELTDFMMGHLSLLDTKRLDGKFDDGAKTTFVCEGEWDCDFCSLDETSLHVAVWWLLCRSTDVWCMHSNKKHLSKFFSYLFLFSVPHLSNHKGVMAGKLKGSFCHAEKLKGYFCHSVTVHHISVEFLQDTVSFEQMIQCTNVSSRFCHIFKKLLSPVLTHTPASNLALDSSPNWVELLNILERGSQMTIMNAELDLHDGTSASRSASVLTRMISMEHSKGPSPFPFSLELKACDSLLNFFCKMPRFYGNTKSFSRYATYILNIERFLLTILLNQHDGSFLYNSFELLRLFVSCRRAMKCLVMGFADKLGDRELRYISAVFDCSSSVMWLFKSVYKIVGLPIANFVEIDYNLLQGLIYSLVDQTSYVFLKISEAKVNATFLFLLEDNKFNKGHLSETRDSLSDNDAPRYFKPCNDWEHLEIIAEALKEHAEKFLVTFKSCVYSVKIDDCSNSPEWNKISTIISCFKALLLGPALAFESLLKEMSLENQKISSLMGFFVSKFSGHITVFEALLNFCLNALISGDSQVAESTLNAKGTLSTSGYVDEKVKLCTPTDRIIFSCSQAEHAMEMKSLESASGSTTGKERSGNSRFRKQRSSASHINCATDFFNIVNKIDLTKFKDSCGIFFQCLLKDTSPQVAFILRQLFSTSAAILRVKCMPSLSWHSKCHSPALNSPAILFGMSYIILQEFSERTEMSCYFSFVLLEGVINFLDDVWNLFSFVDPDVSKDVFTQLIDLHLKAMGRCISLQGETVPSYSHDSEFDTKILEEQNETSWNNSPSLGHGRFCLDSLKTKLRMSFKKYITNMSVVFLELAIQIIERKLVGVRPECTTVYQLNTGMDGGMISSAAAASIEFFELILDCFSGHRKFLKKSIPSLVDAIINIIFHLQNPSIFYAEKIYHDRSKVGSDAGKLILMCVEVLAKVAGRRSFHMDACRVSQCFHIPLVFFVGFHKFKASHLYWNSSIFSCNQVKDPLASRKLKYVDRHFSVELYTSCCRLMCSTLKSQKRHAERCIYLLEESVSTLLSCLEVVDSDTAKRKGYFSWELQDAVKCAGFLRRIYEEIRHQKISLGRYASLLLSNYISTFSGCSPSKAGIRREIDEALRPGVYSLIDICTRADLQRLHSILTEGACRSTLANLLRDYQQNFQYEGKI